MCQTILLIHVKLIRKIITYHIYSIKRRPRINAALYVDLQRNKRRPQINAALNVIHKQFMDRPPEAYTCACGTIELEPAQFSVYAFGRSIEEMPFRGLAICRQKEWSKEVCKEL